MPKVHGYDHAQFGGFIKTNINADKKRFRAETRKASRTIIKPDHRTARHTTISAKRNAE